MIRRSASAGFTAVELLITLFVAAAFLVAGYQLFNLVIRDGGDTRVEATAGNVAYDYLRRYADSASNPCTPSTPLASSPVTIEGAANATISISITCPQNDAPSLSQIEAIVAYGIGVDAHTVKFATYADKSRGATPNVEVSDGLIGWWKLNGNANNSAGSVNGTTTGVTPAASQNGQGAGAYQFTTSAPSYILVPSDNLPKPTSAFTVTGWFYPTAISSTAVQSLISTTNGGGWSMFVNPTSSSCASKIQFQAYVGGAYIGACSTATPANNSWVFAAGVYDGPTVKLYINNGAAVSVSAPGSMTWPTNPVPLCIGGEPGTGATGCTESAKYFNGRIDDVRFYDRALSASEITQLYNGGAK